MIFTFLVWVKLRSPRSRVADCESREWRFERWARSADIMRWGGQGTPVPSVQAVVTGDHRPLLTSAQSSPRSYPRAQVSCPLEATEIVTRKVTQESCMTMASLQNAVCEFFDIRENVSKSTTKQFKVFKVIKRYYLVCLCLHGMHLDHIS